jgi:hypothetical protein
MGFASEEASTRRLPWECSCVIQRIFLRCERGGVGCRRRTFYLRNCGSVRQYFLELLRWIFACWFSVWPLFRQCFSVLSCLMHSRRLRLRVVPHPPLQRFQLHPLPRDLPPRTRLSRRKQRSRRSITQRAPYPRPVMLWPRRACTQRPFKT